MHGESLGPALVLVASALFGQAAPARPAFEAFEVASIKPSANSSGRFIKMQSAHRFFAKDYSLKALIGAAYNLTPDAISGGPAWIDSERYDLLAGTPGEVRPNLYEQMSMLRKLLAERFHLAFRREPKNLSIYAITIGKGGSKLKEAKGPPDGLPELINVIYPDHVALPARNATVSQFASMLQRAVLDRPVVDQAGLSGKYDFDLEWTPDDTQFGGELPKAISAEAARPTLYAALQEQLGLKLQATKGPVQTLVILHAERPSEN